jgi:hypothetical protein
MTPTARRTSLSAANGGWVRVTIDDDQPFDVRVRPNERGRLEVVELRLAPGGPIDSTTLRQVQLAHVETLVNMPNLREHLVARLEVPGPVVYDRTDAVVQPETAVVRVEAHPATVRVTDHASGEAHGQQRATGQASGQRVEVELTDNVSVADTLTVTSSRRRPRARLRVPETNPKPPSFYRQVAAVYTRLAAQSHRPVVELAEANQVPWSTAQRWVKEARRRGFLPPGQKGRRG